MPSSEKRRRLILSIVETDSTFEKTEFQGEPAWIGKCLFCSARLVIRADGEPRSRANIEHIQPRTHGGTDELINLAIACRGCNSEKGRRHDVRNRRDPKLIEIVEKLAAKRRARWRIPPGNDS